MNSSLLVLMFKRRRLVCAGFCMLMAALPVIGQTLNPYYANDYNVRSLNVVPGLPGSAGGLSFKAGDPNKLLIGGNANSSSAKVFQIDVVRDGNSHITGFTGTAVAVADAGGLNSGGIDGGLAYGPGNVLCFTSYSDNTMGQIKPGSSIVSRYIELTPLGVGSSVGGLVFVPPGIPGTGKLKLLSYNTGNWYGATATPDGNGTFNVAVDGKVVPIGSGPEGAFYVAAGNRLFPKASVLVAEYSASDIAAYEVDTDGDPIPASRRQFMTVGGPEGAAVDPLTGDFLFSSFTGGSQIIAVGGFLTPPPTVQLTSPADGASFGAPATVTLTADAAQPNGIITNVRFFVGTDPVGNDDQAPYFASASRLAAGNYLVSAVATDGSGRTATSSVVNITVTNIPPQVTLTNPVNSASYPLCSSFTLIPEIIAGSGSITDVTFYNGTTVMFTRLAPPYTFIVTNAMEAAYAFSVRVRDSVGQSVTSKIVNVTTVNPPLHTLIGGFESPGQIEFCFTGIPGTNYVFEATANLFEPIVWVPVQTSRVVNSALIFSDSNVNSFKQRFYRARGRTD
ncbi:MAG: hypothetical protein JWN25_3374 [Verrucomicrobiales bacterium]|nr:hypothetical protein [Verrucomicrobiales bacterium]